MTTAHARSARAQWRVCPLTGGLPGALALLLALAGLRAFAAPSLLSPPSASAYTSALREPVTPPPLLIPVLGVTASALRDNFVDAREGNTRVHEAIDITAPSGTPVLAADDGRIVKLFLSRRGGITIYQFDTRARLAYYYAHLERYADGLAEGQVITRGTVIGYVGSTGNAGPDSPHLHFAVIRLRPERHWWEGEAINPFPYLGGTR
ncbi:MAG: M23 family metallopeptidase [Variovorax sp.]